MTETIPSTDVMVVDFKDLPQYSSWNRINVFDKYDDSYYCLVPSDHPNNILRFFPNKDLLMTAYRHSTERGMLTLYDRNHDGSKNYNFNDNRYKTIIVLLDDKDAKFTSKQQQGHYREFFINDRKFSFSSGMYNMKFELLEIEDKFFQKLFQWQWSVNAEASTYNSDEKDPFRRAVTVVHNLGIDMKNLSRETYSKILNTITPTLSMPLPDAKGIGKVLTKLLPFVDSLRKSDILGYIAFRMMVLGSKTSIENVSFSVVFNKIFADCTTQEQFDKICIEASDSLDSLYGWRQDLPKTFLGKIMNMQPDARDVKKAALKRKNTGAFNKIMDDLEFVKVDEATHPLTHAAIYSGELPLGIFFRKTGDSYFVYNDNWDVWEKALASEYVDEIKIIAKAAGGRSIFEKDIMSYLHFTFTTIPAYLEKHTGKKWKGIPKMVTSTESLEAPKDGGTTKTRSALTPIVDNEKCTITVPYAAIRESGYSTTYCYALDYNVLVENYSFKGNVVTREVEKALNGRDDYGLMFYTLTGSDQARGYPTFLIIFERLDDKTTVHFHRTHPMRSKDGEPNPINNWIKGCYKWMVGNVNFERIMAQQGDLAFVSIDKFPEGEPTMVAQYDSHCFERNVEYLPYTKKDKANVLGYVNLPLDTKLNHTHHRNRVIPAGVYEIRQCRSWEANPKGIWSLRID